MERLGQLYFEGRVHVSKMARSKVAGLVFKLADANGRIALGARFAGKRFTLREEEDGTLYLAPLPERPNIGHSNEESQSP